MRRRWLDLVFVLYLMVVAVGVFGPEPGEPLDQTVGGVRRIEAEVRSVISGGDSEAGSTPARTRGVIGGLDAEDVGNIVVFVPLGVLFPARWPRWRWWTIPAGVALSASIELTQLLFLSWRSPSLIDVRWNSLGAVLGFSLWLGGRAVATYDRRRRRGGGSQPPARHHDHRSHTKLDLQAGPTAVSSLPDGDLKGEPRP